MFMRQTIKQIIFLCRDNKFETFLSPKVLFVHVEYHNKSSKLYHLLAEVNIVINHCTSSKLLCLKCADLLQCLVAFVRKTISNGRQKMLHFKLSSINCSPQQFCEATIAFAQKKQKVLFNTLKILDNQIFFFDSSWTKQIYMQVEILEYFPFFGQNSLSPK